MSRAVTLAPCTKRERQTGTSLDIIEEHYGAIVERAEELSQIIAAATAAKAGTPPEPSSNKLDDEEREGKETPDLLGGSLRAGDRDRTGDVQLGKQKKELRASSRKR